MALVHGEFKHLETIYNNSRTVFNLIGKFKPFLEDPAEMYDEIEACINDMKAALELLQRIDAGLKSQNLR